MTLQRCLKPLSVMLASLLLCVALRAQDQQPLTIVDGDLDDRVVVVDRRGTKLGVPIPWRLGIGVKTSGELELGFMHSGYTQRDPDGRHAMLTVTVRPKNVVLTAGDRQALEAKGVRMFEGATVSPVSTEIDLTLKADPVEEARLRHAYGFPRTLSTASASTPVQIRWDDKEGSWLFHRLTDVDGLRLVLRSRVDIALAGRVVVELDSGAMESVLALGGETPTFSWTGGRFALAMALADRDGFRWRAEGTQIRGAFPGHDLLTDLGDKIGAVAQCAADGRCSARKEQLRQLRWSKSMDTRIELRGAGASAMAPGSELNAQPKYVKDLSGDGVGLAALLTPASKK